jgi:predicted nucleic acid-binding protein
LILVDTSVWVDLFGRRPTRTLASERLEEIATCPPVVQEILQGVRDDQVHRRLKDHLLALPCLGEPVSLQLFLLGADLYRAGRRRGLTIRSATDCLIAAVAIENRATVWHIDRDFAAIARYTDLRTLTARAVV